MAKKPKTYKLLKAAASAPEKQKPIKGFGTFANRLASAKQKKMENMTDTQKRMQQSKRNNKIIKVSKKAKRFALLDDDDGQGDMIGLTHKGKNIFQLKQFDDVNFNQSDMQNDEDFENIQHKMNFAGFQATDNLLQQNKQQPDQDDQSQPKSKKQIYKEIIEKSKAYKLFRQEQYQENLNIATQLDENFSTLAGSLKFRNRDRKLHDKLQNRDADYEALINELKDDERIVSNKIIEKSEKLTQRIRNKKNQQLKKLMQDSDGQENDVRGWVQEDQDKEDVDQGSGQDLEEVDFQNDDNESCEIEAEEKDSEMMGEDEVGEQASYDELDDVDLSSVEGKQDQEEQQNDADGELEVEADSNSNFNKGQQEYSSSQVSDDDNEQISHQQEKDGNGGGLLGPFDDQLQSDQDESSQLSEQIRKRERKNKKINKSKNKGKNSKQTQNNKIINQSPAQQQPSYSTNNNSNNNKNNKQKQRRKLNTIY